MRTLFLHGMGARPKEWQLNCFIENELEPYALHLDYSNVSAFEILSKYIEENQIKFLIGRSHGGYLSYWLAEEYGIPCLIINPHLSIRLKKQMQPPITQRRCPICLAVLGSDDLVVDSERTIKFLEEEINIKKILKIRTLNGIGHPLDFDTFSEQIKWALSEIKNLNKGL